MATKAKIGVLGASGYTGSDLVRLLLRHPRAEIVLLTADRSAGKEMRVLAVHRHGCPIEDERGGRRAVDPRIKKFSH